MTQLKSRKNRGFRRGVGGVCGFVMRFAALCALSQQRKYNFFCEIQRQKTRFLEDSYIFFLSALPCQRPPYFTPCGGCFGDRAGWTSFLLRENMHEGGIFLQYIQIFPVNAPQIPAAAAHSALIVVARFTLAPTKCPRCCSFGKKSCMIMSLQPAQI